VKNNDSNKGAIIQVEEYNVIGNFTQFVTATICDDDILHVGICSSMCKVVRWYFANHIILWANYSILWLNCTCEWPSTTISI